MGNEKRLRRRFNILINDLKLLRGSKRIQYIKTNVLKVKDINYHNNKESLLKVAVESPDDEINVEIIQELVAQGAKMERVGYRTLLYYAIEYCCTNNCFNIQTIKYLMEHIVDRSALFSEKVLKSSLFVDILDLYIQKGFDINYEDTVNDTLLIFAIMYNYPNAIKILLEKGADVNFINNNEHDALFWAIITDKYNIDVLYLLLEYGANIKNISLINIYDRVFRYRYDYNPVFLATKMKVLIENGLDLTNKNNIIEKFLLKIIEFNRVGTFDLVKIFLRRDDININYEKNDISLLIYAIRYSTNDIIKLFLNYNAYFKNSWIKHGIEIRYVITPHAYYIDKEIYDITLKTKDQKRLLSDILPKIRMVYGEFTMHPSSIYSQTLAVKWHLAQDTKNLCDKLLKDKPALLEYYGIGDNEILQLKILDQMSHA